MNCPVFCAPNAFPCHFGPAASATEVNAKPLSATLIVVASSRIKAGTPPRRCAGCRHCQHDRRRGDGNQSQRAYSASGAITPDADNDASECTHELGDPDQEPSGRSVPSLLADQPDHTECRKGELRKHQQCRDDVNAPQEPVRAIRVDRLDRAICGLCCRPRGIDQCDGADQGENAVESYGQSDGRTDSYVRSESRDGQRRDGHAQGL